MNSNDRPPMTLRDLLGIVARARFMHDDKQQELVCLRPDDWHTVVAELNDMKPPWPMRGVRVEGDTVVITVKGGNDAARWLCGTLVEKLERDKTVEARLG